VQRYAIATLIAAIIAIGIGLVAGWVRDDHVAAIVVTFAIFTFPPLLGLAVLLLDREPESPRLRETVEYRWAELAGVAAMRDLIMVLTLATMTTTIFDIGGVPPVIFLIIAMADWFGRTLLLGWRER